MYLSGFMAIRWWLFLCPYIVQEMALALGEMALALGAMEALDSTAPMESKPQAEIAMSALDERIYKRARKGK